MKQGVITYLDSFLYQARKSPNKPFILFEEKTLTYQEVNSRSNQFANTFRIETSLKQGDVVALLMCNEPDFICVWLGLCKLGCQVAFLNVNIKAKSLLHCFQSCGSIQNSCCWRRYGHAFSIKTPPDCSSGAVTNCLK